MAKMFQQDSPCVECQGERFGQLIHISYFVNAPRIDGWYWIETGTFAVFKVINATVSIFVAVLLFQAGSFWMTKILQWSIWGSYYRFLAPHISIRMGGCWFFPPPVLLTLQGISGVTDRISDIYFESADHQSAAKICASATSTATSEQWKIIEKDITKASR